MAGILDSFLGSLGQGLQTAGGILSPDVYQNQMDQQKQLMAIKQRQAEQTAQQTIQAVQNGSMPPEQAQQVFQQLGPQFQALGKGIGPTPQAQQSQSALAADQKFSQAIGGLQPSALTSSGDLLNAVKGVPLDALAGPKGQAFMQHVSQMKQREDSIQQRKDTLQQQMEFKHDELTQRAEVAAQRSEDTRLGIEQRRQAAEESAQIRRALIGMNAAARRQGIELKQQAAADKKAAADAKVTAPIEDLLSEVDAAMRMAEKNPEVVGGMGALTRGKEFVQGMIDPSAETPSSTFKSQIYQIQSKFRKLPTEAANRFKVDVNKIDDLVKGVGLATSYPQFKNSMQNLRDNLAEGLSRRGGTPAEQVGASDAKPASPVVQSKEERDALPPGSHYTYNRKTYVKGQ